MIEINELLKMFESSDYELRIEAIDIAYDFSGDIRVTNALLKSLRDEDSLVKVSAIEAVGDCGLEVVDFELEYLLRDKDLLVRCAALITVGMLGKVELLSVVKSISASVDGIEFVSSCYSLYLLGNDEYLIKALNCLSDKDYIVRCHVVNLAYNFLKEADVSMVIDLLKSRVKVENTEAVQSS